MTFDKTNLLFYAKCRLYHFSDHRWLLLGSKQYLTWSRVHAKGSLSRLPRTRKHQALHRQSYLRPHHQPLKVLLTLCGICPVPPILQRVIEVNFVPASHANLQAVKSVAFWYLCQRLSECSLGGAKTFRVTSTAPTWLMPRLTFSSQGCKERRTLFTYLLLLSSNAENASVPLPKRLSPYLKLSLPLECSGLKH